MKTSSCGALALLMYGISTSAFAGIYGDDVTRCMVKFATDADQVALVQWIFANAATHPALKAYVSTTQAQREDADKKMAAITSRLLGQDCHKEVVAAMKYEGGAFMETSFGALGEIAMRGMMNDPDVNKNMGNWVKYIDPDLFTKMATEAGKPAPEK
jgi:hypothetical protein